MEATNNRLSNGFVRLVQRADATSVAHPLQGIGALHTTTSVDAIYQAGYAARPLHPATGRGIQ